MMVILVLVLSLFFSSRRRHTRCALGTGVQTWLFRSQQAHNGNEQAIYRVGHDIAQLYGACEPVGRGYDVHIVADRQAAQFFEHQDQAVGHEDLLQIIAVVQKAVESPLNEIAQDIAEEQTSALQSLMRISYDVFCLNKIKTN